MIKITIVRGIGEWVIERDFKFLPRMNEIIKLYFPKNIKYGDRISYTNYMAFVVKYVLYEEDQVWLSVADDIGFMESDLKLLGFKYHEIKREV